MGYTEDMKRSFYEYKGYLKEPAIMNFTPGNQF